MHTKREKKGIMFLNRAWLVLVIIQCLCLVSHIINGLTTTALMTAAYIAALSSVHVLMRRNKVNAAKIAAMAIINANTALMAVFLGAQTRVIDFLLLTALMPLYLFETKSRKLIFGGIALSVVPFAIYQYATPYIRQYALPLGEQLAVAQTTTWALVFCLVVLLSLIYSKNNEYEKEVHEKEDELVGQKRLYECVLDQIPIDIVTFDRQLRYTYVNSTAIADEEVRKWLIGKTNTQYFEMRGLDLNTAAEREKILHAALEKETEIRIEEAFIDRQGVQKHSLKGASPIYSEDKKGLLCIVGYSLDITAMKDAEKKLKEYAVELERKNEDLRHFVNATSHDLKTPLRIITSNLQLLERKNIAKLDEDSLSLMQFTVKSVKHLNQLIGDIYQYSVADRHDKPAEVVELSKVLEDVLKQMAPVIEDKHAEVRYGILPTLKVAPSHLGMIFSNLVGNALKYNNAMVPRVLIGCTETDTDYVIKVSDNGIGIPEQYRKQIFEIFKRLHTPDEYEGTGVGLAICKKIVENYGGKIWLESNPGSGSAFYFNLPKEMVSPDAQDEHPIFQIRKFARTA